MAEIKCQYQKLVPINKMVPHPKNPHVHSPEQIDRLAKLIDYQGVRHPIIISKKSGFIVAGHGRLAALKKLNVKQIPVDVQAFENEAQEYAFIVSDNAIGKDEWAALNHQDIGDYVKSLEDFDIGMLGMKDFNLETWASGQDGLTDEDAVPEIKDSIVKTGEIWQLGNHRLMCGDSTKIEDVERLMNGEKADITFTSPPYNAGCFGFQGGKDKYKGTSDDKSQDEYYQFLMGFTSIAMEVSGIVLVNNQFLSGNIHALAKYIGALSDEIKDVFCWVKNTAPPNVNPGVFTNRWEAIYAFEKGNTKKGFPVKWQGKFSNVIEGETAAKENDNSDIHQATMPTYLPLWFLERLDYVKSVYEPFSGTGTTAIACEKTNRKCFMMEIDEHYCSVIVERWQQFTGKEAVKVG